MELLDLIYPDIRVRMMRVYEDMQRTRSRGMKACGGTRTHAVQAEIYAKGRTTPGPIVSHAKPGESFHNYGVGVDSCFTGMDPFLVHDKDSGLLWSEYGRFCKAHGLVWGGSFHMVDKPHAQLAYGLTLPELQQIYSVGKLPGVWTTFDKIRGMTPGEGWEKLRSQLVLI